MSETLKEEFKEDPKAEALIEAIMSLNLDVKEEDIRYIFNLGAVYGALKVTEQSRRMILASLEARRKRASDGGAS